MTNILKSIITLSLVLYSPFGLTDELKSGNCQTQIECTVTQGNTQTTVTTNNQLSDGTVIRRPSSGNTTTTTTTINGSGGNFGSAGTAGSGAYTQAQAAKNKANLTMIAAFATAAIMAAMCNKPPGNKTPCILAGIAAAAGIMAAMKKNEAQKVMDSLGGPEILEDKKITTDESSKTTGDNADATLASIKANLAKEGYKLNTDGSTTLPNGSTVAADLNTASLQGAGMSASQIQDLQNGLANMKRDIAEKAAEGDGTAVADGSSGGMGADGTGGGGGSGDSNDLSIAGAGVEAERSGNRDPASWSGFFKQYGDSQIGVAQSDIFLMVEKRVETERKTMGH